MELTLKRIYTNNRYTIGHLYVDGVYQCDTLEDTDRGLDQNMPIDEIIRKKVYSRTAIPTGRYDINLNIFSPSKGNKEPYKTLCKGKIPRIMNIPAWEGVLIHIGNTENDTAGCLLVGYNTVKGKVLNSKKCFIELYTKLYGEKDIHITIERNYKI